MKELKDGLSKNFKENQEMNKKFNSVSSNIAKKMQGMKNKFPTQYQ